MPSRKHRAAGAPADAARPSRYSSELARAICDAAATGESLTDICARPDRPDRDVVSRWLATNADFQAAYARSLEVLADRYAEEIRARRRHRRRRGRTRQARRRRHRRAPQASHRYAQVADGKACGPTNTATGSRPPPRRMPQRPSTFTTYRKSNLMRLTLKAVRNEEAPPRARKQQPERVCLGDRRAGTADERGTRTNGCLETIETSARAASPAFCSRTIEAAVEQPARPRHDPDAARLGQINLLLGRAAGIP